MVIPDKLFDIGNDLQLGEPYELPKKPRKLKVKLHDHNLMVEMSIVAGNDYTGPYMQNYLDHKSETGRYMINTWGGRCIQNFANLIQEFPEADKHPYLAKCIKMDHGFEQAVIHSRNFYNLRGEPDKCPQKGAFSQVIEEKIRSGQYHINIMSMHNNFYWYRMLLEDNSQGAPCAECALTPLRAYLYRIVLPRQEQLVNEHGRSPYTRLRNAWVIAKDDGRAPPLDKIKPDRTVKKLQTFHLIWSHQERGEAVNWFDRYGRKKGFICYILRYFLLLNWRQNLQVKEEEFLALVAMVMGRWDEKKYQAIVIRPTVRCVTIGNWMQDVYRHGYQMFGSVLHIRHEFPLPSELFSGSVWTAMYMACQDDTFKDAFRGVSSEVLDQFKKEKSTVIYTRENNGVSSEVLDQIKEEKSTVIYTRENNGVSSEVLDQIKEEKSTVIYTRENRDMIRDIVQGVFLLDDEKL